VSKAAFDAVFAGLGGSSLASPGERARGPLKAQARVRIPLRPLPGPGRQQGRPVGPGDLTCSDLFAEPHGRGRVRTADSALAQYPVSA